MRVTSRNAVSGQGVAFARRIGTLAGLLCALLLLLSTATPTQAAHADRRLYTSSVAYCSSPIAILVSDLGVKFYPDNRTLEFDLTAASIQDDLNVTVALNVNAYGLGLFNIDIDLCTLLGGALCPLPQYEFSGGATFPIPDSIVSEIPNIAYTIPNLEALATIQLTDSTNGEVVGCVQATLSNGHTAHQSGVVWGTVALALFALFSSMLHSVIAQSIGAAQWRLIDVMLAIQHPAIASLLSLSYPQVFVEYGTNFAWSIGLVNIPSLQRSITQTRSNTGGHHQAVFGANLTAEIATRLNPFSSDGQAVDNDASNNTVSFMDLGLRSLSKLVSSDDNKGETMTRRSPGTKVMPISSYVNLHKPAALLRRQQYAPNTGPGGQLITGGNNVTLPIVTSSPKNNGGIGVFAERVYVAPANAFLTVLTSMAILLAILIAALLLVLIIAFIARALSARRGSASSSSNSGGARQGKLSHQVSHWSHRVTSPGDFLGTIVLATLGRYLMITFPVFFIFAFYQWAYGDSWVPHLIAGIFTVIFLAAAAAFFLPMVRHARRGGSAETLYYQDDIPPAHADVPAKRWGQMAHMYRPRFYWFSAFFLLYSILRACFISFAQGRGTRQAIGLLVLEVILFLVLCIFRVGRDKKSDFVFILLCFSRVAAWAVCIAFIPQANVRTIPRVIVGFVLLVVTALPIIFLFFLTLYDLFTPFLKSNRRNVVHPNTDEDNEKTTTAHATPHNGSSVSSSSINNHEAAVQQQQQQPPQTTQDSDATQIGSNGMSTEKPDEIRTQPTTHT